MAHRRTRYLGSLVQKGLKFSPLVGILGHRQVGKTTLAQILAKPYYTLDLRSTLEAINADPLDFLRSQRDFPVVLDECQYSPDLFPALKELVRNQKTPGQFILTGSVRFTSRKAIKESLTGRIITFELLPMDWNEAHSRDLGQSLFKISNGEFSYFEKSLPALHTNEGALVDKFLLTGGLPGAFAVREKSILSQRFESQFDTILSRDLRLIQQTSLSYTVLRELLKILALNQGTLLDLQKISRQSRISIPTLKKLLYAFEALFLIRLLKTRGDFKKPTFYLEDQGEATHLIGHRRDQLFDFERFLYANLRNQIHYRPESRSEIFRYQTRAGVQVPLCFELPKGIVGIMPIISSQPTPKDLGGASSFLKYFKNSRLVFVAPNAQRLKISERLWVLNFMDVISR